MEGKKTIKSGKIPSFRKLLSSQAHEVLGEITKKYDNKKM